MIGRGPDKRQPCGDIHAIIKAKQFQRDMPLVMIHRHHHIILSLISLEKYSIRRARPINVHTFCAGIGNGWRQDTRLFIAKQTILARMRIHACHGDTRFNVTHTLEESISNTNHRFDTRGT
ncbi:Uncharacterised protein [Salmonella enterica subsp. enterica serovar Typhi]|nr:Uncharacterised protein [Salmonella enterica subsp. enterica serovar Typhi]